MSIWGNVRILVIHGHRCVVFRLLRVSLKPRSHTARCVNGALCSRFTRQTTSRPGSVTSQLIAAFFPTLILTDGVAPERQHEVHRHQWQCRPMSSITVG